MNNKVAIFKLSILILCFFMPSIKAENNFDGEYKSNFVMRMNTIVYQGNYKCPREVPITIQISVVGDQIKGFIRNNHEKCDSWQNASITGSIDKEGNFLKTKFIHEDKLYGRREDAYKIEGNILEEMTLKSKSRMYWKDQKFSFTDQRDTGNYSRFIDQNNGNNSKNMNINSSEIKNNQLEEQKEKELKQLKEKQLKEKQLQEKQLQEKKEIELKKSEEKQLKEQKRIKRDSNLLFN